MKEKLLFGFVGLFLASISLTSCSHEDDPDEDRFFDFAGIYFEVNVINKAGENLLEPSTPGNILDKDIYIIFNGLKYEVTMGKPNEGYFPYPYTRENVPIWYGAFIAPSFYYYPMVNDSTNKLWIGNFNGRSHGETVDLFIENEKYVLSFTNVIHDDYYPPDIDRHFYLNGRVVGDHGIFTITID